MLLGLVLVDFCLLRMVFIHLPAHVCHAQPMSTQFFTGTYHLGSMLHLSIWSWSHVVMSVTLLSQGGLPSLGARSGTSKSWDNDARILGNPGWTMGLSGQ